MDTLLSDALLYNMYWQAKNTPDMANRGVIVRRDIPEWIAGRSSELAAAIGVGVEDVGIEGRDGTGLKTELPWVRVYSEERSPSATTGWYIVYLFSATGDRVYLSLSQGTTIWNGVDFAPRPPDELTARVRWARSVLASIPDRRTDLVEDIQLDARRTDLGAGYELGNVYALQYDLNDIPGPDQLEQDLLHMAELLGHIYRAYGGAAYVPGDLPPELFDAVISAERAAGVPGAKARGGQGFGLTKEQQGAVESYAVQVARKHLKDDGWAISYVGDRKTWDIEAKKADQKLYVEVKGTTSPGTQVILTGAQVKEYGKRYPDTMLIVVHSIDLDRSASPPSAAGGHIECWHPWAIDQAGLEAISWKYTTGIG